MAGLRNSLKDAVRKLAYHTSVDQLKRSGVKNVNVLGIDRIVALIDEAVNRSLRHKLIASERAEVIDATKEEFLRLLKSKKDLQRSNEELLRDKQAIETESDELRVEMQRMQQEIDVRFDGIESRERARYEGDDEAIANDIGLLFREMGDAPTPALQEKVYALVTQLVTRERQAGQLEIESARDREVDNMRRRISKLQRSLDVTEKKLHEVSQLKDVEHGVASLYREVQGLDSGDTKFEKKKGLMDDIFKANLALQRQDGA